MFRAPGFYTPCIEFLGKYLPICFLAIPRRICYELHAHIVAILFPVSFRAFRIGFVLLVRNSCEGNLHVFAVPSFAGKNGFLTPPSFSVTSPRTRASCVTRTTRGALLSRFRPFGMCSGAIFAFRHRNGVVLFTVTGFCRRLQGSPLHARFLGLWS